MSKRLKILTKALSVFLAVLLVIQIAPMQVLASSVKELEADSETSVEVDFSYEDVSKREEYVKHFRLSDGTYQAVQYDVPVHYLSDGEWVEYDNSLVEVAASDEENEGKIIKNKDLINTSADFTVRFSKKTNGHKFVCIEKDGYTISWYYVNSKKKTAKVVENEDDNDNTTPEKVNSQVVYENVFKDTDLEYIVNSTGVKENIILNSSKAPVEYVAEYKADGLTPVQIDSKSVELQDANGNSVYTLYAPYMYDAVNESSTGVYITLSDVKNGKFTITTTLDSSWLNDEARAFPVVADPLLESSRLWTDETHCESAYIASETPNATYGKGGANYEGSLYVGNFSGRGKTRTLIKTPTLPTLSVADTVVSAEMAVYVYTCYPETTVNLYRVTSDWEQDTVCWNSNVQYDSAIVDYQTVQHIEKTTENATRWQVFEITELVQGWYSGEYENNGVMLYSDKENNTSQGVRMFSSGYPTTAQARPVLLVTYRNASGYENYYSYTNMNAGRNGAASVNNYNGNLVFSQPITVDNGGNLSPVSISLVYNSNGKNAPYTYLAKNMQTNYHLYVRYDVTTAENGYKYYLNDADGTRHWFWFDGDSVTGGKDEDGLGYVFDVIEKGADSLCGYADGDDYARFRITDKDKNKMYFNTAGNLVQITNANGVSSTVQYETVQNTLRMKSITDGAGRVYMFGYHSVYPYLCVSVTDPAGRTASFEYGNGLMQRITFPDGKTYTLSYTDYELTSIGSIDGTRTAVSYDSTAQKRVAEINWGTSDTNLLESYSFIYKQNETSVTDIQGRSYTYQFNDFGQNTGIVSNADGLAQYFEYKQGNTTEATANKLISQSKVIGTTVNYVKNSGFVNNYNGYQTYAPDSTDSPTVTVDTTNGNFTKNSLKVYKPSTNSGNVMAVQYPSGVTAGTYTLSGYINTDGETLAGTGAYFGVEFRNSDGALVYTQRAEKIYKTDGWQRVSLTFTLPENHTLSFVLGFEGFDTGSCGTVWFDDLQLEKGTGMSSCNLVENGGLTNGSTSWNCSNITTTDVVEGFDKALYLNGSSQEHWQDIGQYIYVQSGKTNDVFSFGAWVKADSAPINSLKSDDAYIPEFYLGIHFYDADGRWLQTEKVPINEDVDAWQFVAGKALAKQDYAKIMVDLVYYYNVNTAYLTGAFCYKEEFGQTYDYDENGNVQSVVDLTNSKSAFAYKGNQMAKMLNPSGSEYFYTYAYNESDLTEAVSTDGQRYSFTYDSKGNVLTSTVQKDKFVTSVEAGGKYIIRNAESGNVIDNGNNTGTVCNWRYRNGNPNQIWTLEATGEDDVYCFKSMSYGGLYMGVKTNANTDNADIITASSPSGDAFKFKVHSNGDGTFELLTKSSNYTKCLDGQPNSSKNYEDNSALKQWTRISNDESQHWYFYPDITAASGNGEQEKISTSATYTASGNFVSSQTDQVGNTTSYVYNETTGTLTSVTDAANRTTSYTYDADTSNLKSVTSGGMTNTYTYSNDRLSHININGGTGYKFLYDAFGRTTGVQVGNGETYNNLSVSEYNASGLLSKFTYGNGYYVNYQYDSVDRITEICYNNSNKYKKTYYYGTDGAVSNTVDFSTGTRTKYVYDLAGRLVGTREYEGTDLTGTKLISSVDYTYADKTDYLTGIKYFSPLGTQTVGFTFGNFATGQMPDQVYAVSWNGNNVLNYTYDDLGRLTNKAINGVDTTYFYVDVNDTKTTTLLESVSTLGIPHSYEYDELGNITSIEFNNSLANSYEYDELNQLVRENNHDQGKTFTYEYVNGNIKYKHEYAYTTGTLPETPNKTIQYHYENDTWGDVLTKITETSYSGRSSASAYSFAEDDLDGTLNSVTAFAQSFLGDGCGKVDLTANAVVSKDTLSNVSTYSATSTETRYTIGSDEIGNITSIGDIALNWNGRKLESVSQDETTLVSYGYNMDGQRVSKTVFDTDTDEYITTEYFYNGSILAGQKKGDDVLIFMYDNNGDVFGFTYNGTPYYYVKNAQNDVYLIINEDGVAEVLYQYDAWGVVTACYDITEEDISAVNPITYRSYYMDIELGFFMYYLNSRYYIADWGRFVSADSYVQTGQGVLGNNMFAYCGNNPVNRADSGGDFWHIVVGATAGTLISGVVKAVSNVIEGKSVTNGLATAMLAGAASGVLASTGIGAVGMAVGNAAISIAENTVNQVVENKGFNNFDVVDMLIDGAIGGVSGAIGGVGKGNKHLNQLGKQTVKRTYNATTHSGLKAGLKEAGKAFVYYGKNTKNYYKAFLKDLPSDCLYAVGTTIAASNYMKRKYRSIFGG